MKISYNWLKQFVEMPYPPEELSKALTDCGLEVEQLLPWQSVQGGLQGLVIGKVLTCERHPNADRLSVTTVETGDGIPKQIVCGAPNVAAGQTVVVALPGAKLFPSAGEPFEIKKSKIRGEASEGMICAEDEIGLGQSHAGIMILPDTIPAGTAASDYFKVENDWIYEIGLTPNRADAASHLGVARDIRTLIGRNKEVDLKLPDVSEFKEEAGNSIHVEIKNNEACQRYSGVEMAGIKVGPSPEWLQHRLKSIGLRPINNIVDVTNYVMHDLGQPLHAFDAEKIRGKKINVGELPAGTKFKTLDEAERTLQGQELMIADEEGPLCIAGVFGGMDSGVSAETTSIFLESACFHPVFVRKSARQHGLHTDSSFRFERGTDPDMTVTALKKAALMITEIAGGRVSSKITDIYPVKIPFKQIELSLDYLHNIIGVEIPAVEVKNILVHLGIEIVKEEGRILSVAVPPFKVDVTRPADLAEEVLRIYGYNNIALPKKVSITPGKRVVPDPEEIIERSGAFLVAQGFREILTNSLTSLSHLNIVPMHEGVESVQVLNPLSNDLALLRHKMLLTGLETIAYNINRRQKDLRFFEYGKTYCKAKDKYIETTHLSLWLTGASTPEHWKVKQGEFDIYHLKAILEQLFVQANVEMKGQFTLKAEAEDSLDNAVSYYLGKSLLAKAGSVKRSILKAMDISQPVWYADIDFEALMRMLSKKDKEVAGPPKFPEVRRDLSMLLAGEVQYGELEKLAFSTEPRLLQQVNLFDVYEGDKIEKGKKSYALSFILRDEEATLQEKQIEAVMDKLMKQFELKLGAVIRKA
jgi:phenylalanyl-tRNA synthetase beta chain